MYDNIKTELVFNMEVLLAISGTMSQWRKIFTTIIWNSHLQYFQLHKRNCWKVYFCHYGKYGDGFNPVKHVVLCCWLNYI